MKDIENMDEHERTLIRSTPKVRSIENREEKDRMYEDKLIDAYIRRYVNLSKQMALDYKRYVINAFLTETYCIGTENPKYSDKYKELTEKALYG